ncbi:MAG: hypothetical protein FJX59_00365, partial [Alphaproteobacteria bacterium]|nr:hypothetical protein [Alphaproteobacteria bacterium]
MNGWHKYFLWITTPLLTVALIAAWQIAVDVFEVSKFIIPRPIEVWNGLIRLLGQDETYAHTWTTIYEASAGFILGSLAGIMIGAVL